MVRHGTEPAATKARGERDTAAEILDSAERLFGEHGIDAVSVRQILEKADINPALAHYHFGSREGLVRAVIERRVGPVNEERLRALDALEAEAAGPPELEALLRAFLWPALRLLGDRPHVARVLAQVHVYPDDDFRAWYLSLYGPALERFAQLVGRALGPDVPPLRRLMRTHFTLGVVISALASDQPLPETVHRPGAQPWGPGAPTPDEVLLEEMVTFCAAGLRAGS